MTANLDRNGRIVRAVSGTLCIAAGVALWPLAWPESTAFRTTLTVALAAFGVFQWFEALARW
jgi:hypothetical protein